MELLMPSSNCSKKPSLKENWLPSSFEKMKSIIKKLGLGYNNIDTYTNDLYTFLERERRRR